MTHGGLISNDFALRIVVNVILEANTATSSYGLKLTLVFCFGMNYASIYSLRFGK
jgi:hypothetical protein